MARGNPFDAIVKSAKTIETEGSWEEVESILGAKLPDDYKKFIGTYGSGAIAGFVRLFNPFSKRADAQLGRRSLALLEAMHATKLERHRPFVVIEGAPQGLLPFGITTAGESLHWIVAGAPSAWTVAVLEKIDPARKTTAVREFGGSTSAFLTAVVDGSFSLAGAPADLKTNPRFVADAS